MKYVRKLWVGLLATALFAAAPTNQLTITDQTSGTQTDRPTRFGRPFAAGEIWNYPQPIVDGTPATSWQATVKTRHRDGSASCDVTAASNEYPITVTCADHGFRNGDWVVIAGVEGNTAANGRHRIVRRGRHTFFLQGATGDGAYTTGGTATGPGPGSVQFAIIVLDDDIDLSADGSVTVTFQDSANACHLGNEATCEAAALTEAEMLAWDSSGWGAEIEATQDNTYTANARTMVDAAHFEYFVAGPILTEVIVRDHSSARTYDFGWTCTGTCTTDYSSATWAEDATDKSLSPVFVLGFYDALPSSVKIEYILENVWYGHLQDQRYSLALTSDSTGSTSEYTKAAFTHYAKTRWRKVFWDGTEPGAVNIDHNEAYWEYSGASPVWADDVEPAAADITAQTSGTCGSSGFDIGDAGCFNKYFPASGDHQAIGVFPQWDSVWAQTFDYDVWSQVWGNGNVSGHIPIHLREASEDTTLYFVDVDADGGTDNDAGDAEAGNEVFGRFFSIDAHPTLGMGGGTVATLSTSHGWTVDHAHQPAAAFLAYVATGEWYLLEELQFWGAYVVGSVDPDHSGCGRGLTFGLISGCQQTRGQGWGLRNLVHSAWASPTGSVEKEYLSNKVDFNLAAFEGMYVNHFRGEHYVPLIGQTDAAPCTGFSNSTLWSANSPYCHGRYFWSGYGAKLNNPLGVPSGSASPGCDSYTTGYVCDAPWMQDYFVAGFYGRGKDLGFRVDGLLRMVAKWRFQFFHEDQNVYMAFGYRIPIMMNGTETWPVSPAQHYSLGYTTAGKAVLAWSKYETYTIANYQYSFTHGALPYMTDGLLNGINFGYVWDWLTNPSNVENTDIRCIDGDIGSGCSTELVEVRWNLAPRFPPTRLISLTPGYPYSIWRYMAPTPDSVCTVNSNGDGLNGTGRYREYVLTGLSASTAYEHVLICDDDPWGGETVSYSTTAAPSGTTDLTVRIGSGDTTSYLDWGYTSSLTETPDSASCASGCELSVAGVTKGLVYYRVRHADGRTGTTTTRNLQ